MESLCLICKSSSRSQEYFCSRCANSFENIQINLSDPPHDKPSKIENIQRITPYHEYIKKKAEPVSVQKNTKKSLTSKENEPLPLHDVQNTVTSAQGKVSSDKLDKKSKKIKKGSNVEISARKTQRKGWVQTVQPKENSTSAVAMNTKNFNQIKAPSESKEGDQKIDQRSFTPDPKGFFSLDDKLKSFEKLSSGKTSIETITLSLEKSFVQPLEDVAVTPFLTKPADKVQSPILLSETSHDTGAQDRGKGSVVTISSTETDPSISSIKNKIQNVPSGLVNNNSETITPEESKSSSSQSVIEIKVLELIAKHIMWDLPLKKVRKEKLFLWLRDLNYKIPELFLEIIKDRDYAIKRLS